MPACSRRSARRAAPGRRRTSTAWWRERRCGSRRSNATCRCCFPAPPPRSGARPRRVPIAIASGARGAEIRRVLEREQSDAAVSPRSSPRKTRRLSKPAPDPYLRAVAPAGAARAGDRIAASDCVAIEDSRWGLESARAAGLRTVAVTQTYDASALTGDRRSRHRLARVSGSRRTRADLCSSVAIQHLDSCAACVLFRTLRLYYRGRSRRYSPEPDSVTAFEDIVRVRDFLHSKRCFWRRNGMRFELIVLALVALVRGELAGERAAADGRRSSAR